MPTTKFRLSHSCKSFDDYLSDLNRMLPATMSVEAGEGGHHILVQTEKDEDASAQLLVDRELDRLYFLTGVRAAADMCRRTVRSDVTVSYQIFGDVPESAGHLNWNYKLGVQLRLWSLASEVEDPGLKILLLYQIIEMTTSKGDFDDVEYTNSSGGPDPLMECKLLRDLVGHAGNADARQLKRYCEHLGFPDLMLDRTDPDHMGAIASRLPVLERYAEQVINDALAQAARPHQPVTAQP